MSPRTHFSGFPPFSQVSHQTLTPRMHPEPRYFYFAPKNYGFGSYTPKIIQRKYPLCTQNMRTRPRMPPFHGTGREWAPVGGAVSPRRRSDARVIPPASCSARWRRRDACGVARRLSPRASGAGNCRVRRGRNDRDTTARASPSCGGRVCVVALFVATGRERVVTARRGVRATVRCSRPTRRPSPAALRSLPRRLHRPQMPRSPSDWRRHGGLTARISC